MHYVGVTIGFLETEYTVTENENDEVLVRVGILSGELSEDVTVTLTTQDDTATGTQINPL